MRSPLPRGFGLIMAAQFASALADNALLIVTIALLIEQGLPGWWAPLLKVGFMAAYVLLAPFVGPLSDAFAKGRIMAVMNGVKMFGLLLLLAGLHPVAVLAVVGLGAAAYAPAKYGLITELVPGEGLVAANGWIEISVVSAALLGAVVGGVLVSDAWVQWAGGLGASCGALMAVYGLSGVLNAFIPDSGHRRRAASIRVGALMRDFARDQRTLWRDPLGGLSLAATTLFWGVGATLQLAVLRWSQERLGLPLDRGAYLQAVIGIGVVIGAAMAGRWVPLSRAPRMLWAGVVLGLLMPLVVQVQDVVASGLLLAAVGVVGGAMVVPLNALLQHRGRELLSPGCSIAVQGFNENLSVLLMVSGYAVSQAWGLEVGLALSGLGLGVAAAILLLILASSRHAGQMQLR